MGLFSRKNDEPPARGGYVPRPHNCETDNVLLDQEGPNVRYWCGICDKTIRVERDVPPPHGW